MKTITEYQARQFCYQNGLEFPDFTKKDWRKDWMSQLMFRGVLSKLIEWMMY